MLFTCPVAAMNLTRMYAVIARPSCISFLGRYKYLDPKLVIVSSIVALGCIMLSSSQSTAHWFELTKWQQRREMSCEYECTNGRDRVTVCAAHEVESSWSLIVTSGYWDSSKRVPVSMTASDSTSQVKALCCTVSCYITVNCCKNW